MRGPRPQLLKNFVVVGVDSSTLSYFQTARAVRRNYASNWPFPRRDHARVIDNLVKAGARQIAIDIQFSQPTDETDDDDLATAIGHAGHVVLATTSVGPHGSTDILGGNAELWSLGHSVAANATSIPDTDGVYRRMQFSFQGLETFGAAIAAKVSGQAGLAESVRRGDRDRADRLCRPARDRPVHPVLAGLRRQVPGIGRARQDGDDRRNGIDPAGSCTRRRCQAPAPTAT